jgi:tetratricopeptide (TPR) repeat protein
MVTLQTTYDYRATESAYRHALSVEPGNAVVQSSYASEAGRIGFPNALDAANRAIVLNPLDSGSYAARGEVLYSVRRYAEARQSFIEAERLGSDSGTGHLGRAMTALAMGRPQEALDICEKHTEGWGYQTCLAIAYCKLGRQPDRQRIQAMMRAEQGDLLAYQYAQIASQCNSQQEALRWLETAYRLRDAGLWDIRTDPMLDPIREAPDFKRVLAELNFPP